MQNRLLFTLIFSAYAFSFLFAQDCVLSTAQIDLDANNVKTRLQASGDLWWDGTNGQYIVPKPMSGELEVTAFHLGGIWIGGIDSGGNMKMAAQTYGRAFGKTDYFPGPLTETGITDPDECANFDQFWSTNSSDINTHIADWNDNGVIDGPIPQSILSWPARGNPHFESIHGFELPFTNQGLAPFVDVNTNGVYDPESGDYPDIHEADQAKWWVFNDAGGVHSESNGIPSQFEIQVLAYAYSSSNESINNATFYDYKFINRSLDQLDSAYVAIWADPDLGCYIDDYVGCDTALNMGYVYNMDALDGISDCDDCEGLNTYCEEIPMVGIKILKGVLGGKMFCNGVDASDGLCNPELNQFVDIDTIVEVGMSSFMYYDGNSFPGGGVLNSAPNFYQLMTATWPGSTWPYEHLTVGGNGYNPGSTDYTNYAFPSPPSDSTGWSMCTAGIEEGDRRMIISSGPFRSFQVRSRSGEPS